MAAATVGAFFLIQHIKVSTPLLTGTRRPRPPVSDPLDGRTCAASTVSFYLLHRADSVDVDVIGRDGAVVARLATGRPMPIRDRIPAGEFTWNGRTLGGQPAPDGAYEVRVHLIHQDRTIVLGPTEGGAPYTITVRRGRRRCPRV
jgi:hypothetical protein